MTKADEPVATVTWEEPATQRGRYDWLAIADELKSNPNEWAKLFDDDKTSLVNAIRQGAVPVLSPALGFEVRTRNNVRAPVRRCSLYMRFVPGASFRVTPKTPAKDGE